MRINVDESLRLVCGPIICFGEYIIWKVFATVVRNWIVFYISFVASDYSDYLTDIVTPKRFNEVVFAKLLRDRRVSCYNGRTDLRVFSFEKFNANRFLLIYHPGL